MNRLSLAKVFAAGLLAFPTGSVTSARPSNPAAQVSKFPYSSKLTYEVTWRMLTAGTATVELKSGNSDGWSLTLDLASAGLVSRLYRVLDTYKASMDGHFCGQSAVLDGQEGKKHAISRLTFDTNHHKTLFEERDLISNATEKKELDVPPCTYEITGALAVLRLMDVPPGKSITLPITDGKKLAYAKVEAQARESVSVSGKNYSTIRYEAFLFDNILYKRKGRLFIWMTDDGQHVPVQFRLQMGFPIGSVLVELQKEEKL
jgi:hypothetical protein